jgi:polyisoprenyl-teichoic acid--peptidoglycan teichoic acid transferase
MKRFLFILALTTIFVFFSYVSFFAWKIYSTGEKITIIPKNGENGLIKKLESFISQKKLVDLKGSGDDRINILLMGIAGKGKAGTNLTDTIMIASIKPSTNQVGLISIPRDFYIQIPDDKVQMKINSVYQYGLNKHNSPDSAAKTLETVISEITSLPINYYVVMNFDGFEKAIDAIGGINITNERDIYDARYPGPNFSYETFELKKGFQHLDGATALKYARERHDDPEGDFGRAKRQQQVMQSAKNKIFSTSTLLDFFALNKLLDTLGDNVKTDISTNEMESFFELSKRLDTSNINNVVIDAWNPDSLLKVSHIFFGNIRAFVLIPRIGNFSEIQELAQNVFDLNKIKRRKEEISKENASVVIINKSGDGNLTYKIKKLLTESFSYKNVITVSDNQKNEEEKTVSFDLTNGEKPFTLDEMVRKLPSAASYSFPENYKNAIKNVSADIVVVLGKDLISKYNMEEDSIEDYKNSSDTNEYEQLLNNQ